MKERFLRSWLMEAQMSPPNPIRAGIPIHWIEGEGITIKIRLQPAELNAASNAPEWNQNCRQLLQGQCLVTSEAQKMFVPKSRRQAT
jgi:hypothetical protein